MPPLVKGQKVFGHQLQYGTIVRYRGKVWQVVGVAEITVQEVPVKHRYGDPPTKRFPNGVGLYEVVLLGVGRLNSWKMLKVFHYIRDHQFTVIRPAT